jgi:hypothetical protein
MVRSWVLNSVQVKTVYFFTAFRVAVRPKQPSIQFVPVAPSQRQRYHGVNLTFTLHLAWALK